MFCACQGGKGRLGHPPVASQGAEGSSMGVPGCTPALPAPPAPGGLCSLAVPSVGGLAALCRGTGSNPALLARTKSFLCLIFPFTVSQPRL